MDLSSDDFVKILIALAIGGVIGFEREFRDKAAGFRTLIFICVGATLYTMMSLRIAGQWGDPGRIASYIVAGVGFLGGGVIMRDGGQIKGITTAATVWLVAALGIAIGVGAHALAGTVATLTVIVLWTFPAFERWVDRHYSERTYDVAATDVATRALVESAFGEHGLRVISRRDGKSGTRRSWRWRASGPLAAHEAVTARLLAEPSIDVLKF